MDVPLRLGHKSIEETADMDGHLTPDATGRAVQAMGAALTRHRADRGGMIQAFPQVGGVVRDVRTVCGES